MRKVRENILVASGNQSLFAANTAVFVTDGSEWGLNGILDGQIVIYNHDTGKSVATNVTAGTADRIVIAVGVDTNGDGVADVLRKPFGDSIYGYSIQAATAEPPRCGVEAITDLIFKAANCDDTFAINITVEDDQTQNQYPFKRPANYAFTVSTEACACDGCESGIDEKKLAVLLKDRINNNVGSTDATKQSVFTKLSKKKPVLPFYAVELFANSYDFCLTPIEGTCQNCTTLDAIKKITFTHPVDGVTTVTFTHAVNPADTETSLVAQLPNIIRQINAALGVYGSAVVTGPTSGTGAPCCEIHLQINSSIDDIVLKGHEDAEIEPCGTPDPFEGYSGYTTGIRIIAKPVDIVCKGDYPPDTPRGYLGRDIKVYPVRGFECSSAVVKKTQVQVLPENLGYEWKWREYTTAVGGAGRNISPWGQDAHGVFGLPLNGTRSYGTTAKCKETYCSYVLEHSIPNTDVTVHGHASAPRGRTIVLIPSGDSVTRSEFETIINSYLASANYPVKQSIVCGSDQDQSEDITVRRISGRIV